MKVKMTVYPRYELFETVSNDNVRCNSRFKMCLDVHIVSLMLLYKKIIELFHFPHG